MTKEAWAYNDEVKIASSINGVERTRLVDAKKKKKERKKKERKKEKEKKSKRIKKLHLITPQDKFKMDKRQI